MPALTHIGWHLAASIRTFRAQACLDMMNNESGHHVIYFPAGTYKITATLRLYRILGGLVVGHGEPTVLTWGGVAGGTLMVSDGISRTRIVGLVFDGESRSRSMRGQHRLDTALQCDRPWCLGAARVPDFEKPLTHFL